MAFLTRPRIRHGEGDVFRLRIELEGVLPVIWRRVLISGRATLHELHGVIQEVMGHDEELGYVVDVDGVRYRDPAEAPRAAASGDSVMIESLGLHVGSRFTHQAEHHGEAWHHVISVEQISPRLIGQRLPDCIDGRRAAPPSDCHGVAEYREMIAALKLPHDAFAAAQRHWLPDNFDPEFVDIISLNAALHRIPKRRPAA